MIKSKLEGTKEFRALPKSEPAITERRQADEDISLREELDSLKASVARIEKRIEDLILYTQNPRPHRQW
jgi:hypothetical protein